MAKAFTPRSVACSGRMALASVVFAHKTTEGWEALLSGLIRGGWTITGSWPIATEMLLRAYVPAILPPSPPAFTSSAALARRTRRLGIGPTCCGSYPCVSAIGCSGSRVRASGARTWSSPVSGQRWRFTAATAAWRRRQETRSSCRRTWRRCGRSSAAKRWSRCWARRRPRPATATAGALEEDARLTALFLWTRQSTDEQPAAGNGVGDDAGGRRGSSDAAPARRL